MSSLVPQLTRIQVDGFRSLKNVALDLGSINVVIGPNGSGKSNLLTALRVAPLLLSQTLQRYVGEQGGASRLLHYGAEATPQTGLSLTFEDGSLEVNYVVRFGYAAGDSLMVVEESCSHKSPDGSGHIALGGEYRKSGLSCTDAQRFPSIRLAPTFIGGMSFYHFHDTSLTSPLRRNAVQADNQCIRADGSNLAAYLYRMQQSGDDDDLASWRLFIGLVQLVAPFIRTLEPGLVTPERAEASAVRLFWTDPRGHRFDAHDLSDGTLRTIALFAALTQPPRARPSLIAIDEPELGLHPVAISLFGGLVRSASTYSQVVIATQSSAVLDQFAADEVVVCERRGGETVFERLDPGQLEHWLENYELSELYDKNVIGGRP